MPDCCNLLCCADCKDKGCALNMLDPCEGCIDPPAGADTPPAGTSARAPSDRLEHNRMLAARDELLRLIIHDVGFEETRKALGKDVAKYRKRKK